MEHVTAGLVEIEPNRRSEVADRYGVVDSFSHIEDAFAEDWDAAVVAVPADRHIQTAHLLADAHIAMLIEKPLSTSLEGIEELICKVRDRGLVAAAAYNYRHHPLYEQMRELFQSGKFGKPLELVSVSGQNFPYYRPAYKDTYYSRHTTGGGALQDALSHHLNMGEWFVGPTERIAADGQHQSLEMVEVEDTIHVLARHGEVLASYSLNQYQPQSEYTLTLICERGMLRAELHENRWRWSDETEGPWNEITLPPFDRDMWFAKQANSFLDTLAGKHPPVCSLQEAYQTQKAICTALEMLQSGQGLRRV